MDERFQPLDSFEQFVLLSVVELSERGETPAHSYDVAQTARDRLEAVERDPFGGIERQEVITALKTLADADLLAKEQAESPTGKGRPGYELAVEGDEILDAFAGATELGSYIEAIRTGTA